MRIVVPGVRTGRRLAPGGEVSPPRPLGGVASSSSSSLGGDWGSPGGGDPGGGGGGAAGDNSLPDPESDPESEL